MVEVLYHAKSFEKRVPKILCVAQQVPIHLGWMSTFYAVYVKQYVQNVFLWIYFYCTKTKKQRRNWDTGTILVHTQMATWTTAYASLW